ncbi:MAG: CocE/NonD family hydrolase [Acidobacteria bacterium]|nr:MAG: CocE/NonD family hydrolase [Acidobacteriota bacterium]
MTGSGCGVRRRNGLRVAAVLGALLLAAAPAFAFKHLRVPASIPMRDGNVLAADVYLPATTGRWPVVLIQTPYDKRAFWGVFPLELSDDPLLKDPDYAFVVTDWRGFFASAGAAVPGYDRGLDGYDTVEWIARQPWCDGRVGTWGASALGVIQLQTAAQRPPHLAGCVPIVAHDHDSYGLYYPGGVYARNKNGFVAGRFGGGAIVEAHPLDDVFWDAAAASGVQPEQIDVPMLFISGWYDHETDLSLAVAAAVQARGGPNARGRQKVLVGPWSHSNIGKLQQGELAYPAAQGASSVLAKEFFDVYLRAVANGYEARPPFRYFRINDDLWVDSDAWPPAGSAQLPFYLTASGELSPLPPVWATASVAYTSDPANPVPTLFGAILVEGPATQGPGDLTPIEARPDVVTFTTAPLAAPLRIEGRPVARLWIECSAPDTDLAVRMTQVTADGRSLLLVDGIRRASLRDSFSRRELLQAGQPYLVEVDLPSVAVAIPAGDRLRIDVASSNYDRFDVNMQDGSSLSDDPGARATTAQVRVLVNSIFTSELVVPTVGLHRVRRHLAAAGR